MIKSLHNGIVCECHARTHLGRVRVCNQDAWYIVPSKNLFLLADGVGSKRHGGLAALLAINYIIERAHLIQGGALDRALRSVNQYLYTKNHTKRYHDHLATTMVILLIDQGQGFFSHVGDSRLYLFREEKLVQLTDDHSLGNAYVKKGKLEPHELEHFPYKNFLTQTLGLRSRVRPSCGTIAVERGDIFLLCSDGLFNYCSSALIKEVLTSVHDVEEITTKLLALAQEGGGGDNITLIVIRVVG